MFGSRNSVEIQIPYYKGEGTYEDTVLGRKIIKAFGRPHGHGVGFGYEDFSYYDIKPTRLKAFIKRARSIVKGKGRVNIFK